MFGGLQFAVPMLVVTCGTLAVGGISGLVAWLRLPGLRRSIGERMMPNALYALTGSVLAILIGFVVFLYLPDQIGEQEGHGIWFAFFAISFFLNSVALISSYRRKALGAAIRIGSTGVAMVHVVGIVLFYWGG